MSVWDWCLYGLIFILIFWNGSQDARIRHLEDRISLPPEPETKGPDYVLDSPDSVPPELRDFAARGFERRNRRPETKGGNP